MQFWANFVINKAANRKYFAGLVPHKWGSPSQLGFYFCKVTVLRMRTRSVRMANNAQNQTHQKDRFTRFYPRFFRQSITPRLTP
jgi:hypothetical protein